MVINTSGKDFSTILENSHPLKSNFKGGGGRGGLFIRFFDKMCPSYVFKKQTSEYTYQILAIFKRLG